MTGWFRRRRKNRDTFDLPAAIDLRAAALAAAEAVKTQPVHHHQPGVELDDIKVVYIAEDEQVGQGSEPGLRMTWHQWGNQFGLLNSVRRLAEQAGGFDAIPFYLWLAIDEPHQPAPDASRLWFRDLPTAPN
jgi:hypothetical protein